jgi:hypothetical protein
MNKVMKSTQAFSMAAVVGTIAATTLSVNPASAVSVTLGGVKGNSNGTTGLFYNPNIVSGNVTTIDFNDASATSGNKVNVSSVNQKGATYNPGDAVVVVNHNGNAILPGPNNTALGVSPFAGPDKNTSPYLTLPTSPSQGPSSVTITLPKLSDYFGLHWGSLDATNQIEFFNGGTRVGLFTGQNLADLFPNNIVVQPGPQNQDNPQSNPYINFFADGQLFNEVVLSETGSDVSVAFETDNHAFRAVPEPLTILGSGLALGFGAIFKKQQSRRR